MEAGSGISILVLAPMQLVSGAKVPEVFLRLFAPSRGPDPSTRIGVGPGSPITGMETSEEQARGVDLARGRPCIIYP